MSRMTASDFVTFIRKGMGNPSSDEWTDTELLRFLNLAQVKIGMTHRPPELIEETTITLTAGTYDYELTATDVLEITGARNDTSGLRLRKGSMDDWVRVNQNSSVSQGTVTRWIENGVGSNYRPQIRLGWNSPDSADTVRFYYLKKPTELVTSPSATTSILREQWDETLLKYAIEIGLQLDKQMRDAQATRQMAAGDEARAAGHPMQSEKKFAIESRIAPETRTRREGR